MGIWCSDAEPVTFEVYTAGGPPLDIDAVIRYRVHMCLSFLCSSFVCPHPTSHYHISPHTRASAAVTDIRLRPFPVAVCIEALRLVLYTLPEDGTRYASAVCQVALMYGCGVGVLPRVFLHDYLLRNRRVDMGLLRLLYTRSAMYGTHSSSPLSISLPPSRA
jgi:hypothetical protein